jgi:hypothetical protein
MLSSESLQAESLQMAGISLFRLYLLRAMYLLMAVGIGVTFWPLVLSHPPSWPLMNSIVASMLAALGLLCVLGLRYPLRMLPLLLFELTWKVLWLTAVALPLWAAGRMDESTLSSVYETILVVILIPIIPWGYVLEHYLRRPADRWR